MNWLPDLPRWAQVVADLVRPGGVLYMVEIHPMVSAVVRANSSGLRDRGSAVVARTSPMSAKHAVTLTLSGAATGAAPLFAHYPRCVEPRRHDNLIRAGFALHAWRLLKQYQQLTEELSPADRYEATLTVCVLQSLLTNCWELWKYLHDKKASRVLEPLQSYTLSMLADPEVEVTNSFPDEPDAKAVLLHVRNALSHPRMKETDPPTTGYTTVEDGTGYVTRLRFTDSPDLNSKGALTEKGIKRTGGDVNQAQVFTIELPLAVLTSWAEEVARVLAQPVMDNWDSAELVALSL